MIVVPHSQTQTPTHGVQVSNSSIFEKKTKKVEFLLALEIGGPRFINNYRLKSKIIIYLLEFLQIGNYSKRVPSRDMPLTFR